VEINADYSIKNFKEKKPYKTGNINGGVYILNTTDFMNEALPEKFSFERDYLEKLYKERKIVGLVQNEYFIDIGIPEDYKKAQEELKQPPLSLKAIDKSWTLFLDRDGVINYEKKNDYILNWQEFRFYEGVKEAMKIVADKFGKVIVVSNQRGVGKELMSENDLAAIHRNMKTETESAGGRIDGIYFCTSIDNTHPERKPNPGMAFIAKNDFAEIDFARSLIAGNKPSDMLFGRNAGIYTAFIASTNPDLPFPHPDIDIRFNSLIEFAKAL
jgi:D-glycero-alpha-D-manno-heptose 1-phosphate guanylyltransferase